MFHVEHFYTNLQLETARQDMREQWLRRLLKNPRLASAAILEPFARAVLAEATAHGQTVLLSLDQTDLGDLSWFQRSLRLLRRRLQTMQPLPLFSRVMRN